MLTASKRRDEPNTPTPPFRLVDSSSTLETPPSITGQKAKNLAPTFVARVKARDTIPFARDDRNHLDNDRRVASMHHVLIRYHDILWVGRCILLSDLKHLLNSLAHYSLILWQLPTSNPFQVSQWENPSIADGNTLNPRPVWWVLRPCRDSPNHAFLNTTSTDSDVPIDVLAARNRNYAGICTVWFMPILFTNDMTDLCRHLRGCLGSW